MNDYYFLFKTVEAFSQVAYALFMSKIPLKNIAVVTLVATSLLSCSPISHTRGNIVPTDKVVEFEVGKTTKSNVVSTIGTPSTKDPFNENIWFYIGEKTEQIAFLQPDVKDRHIVRLVFDKSDTLRDIKRVDEKEAKKVNLVDKTTPTSGLRLNAFQQFVGNIGRFNKGMGQHTNNSGGER